MSSFVSTYKQSLQQLCSMLGYCEQPLWQDEIFAGNTPNSRELTVINNSQTHIDSLYYNNHLIGTITVISLRGPGCNWLRVATLFDGRVLHCYGNPTMHHGWVQVYPNDSRYMPHVPAK